MSSNAPVVATRNLTVAHGERTALHDVSISVERGTVVALIGPNGSGKSSLMNSLAGLLKPVSGSIEIFGRPPGEVPISYVFQATHVPAHLPLTVHEVVKMGRYRRCGLVGRIGPEGREAINRAIRRVDITGLESRQLQELSGGQRQRVLVAQGLAGEADLLMLDEPMTGLDVMARERILSVIAEESSAGRTVIFSTHDMSEAEMADQVVLLAGRLVSCGEPSVALAEENLRIAYMSQLHAGNGAQPFIDDAHHHDAHHHGHHHDHGHGHHVEHHH